MGCPAAAILYEERRLAVRRSVDLDAIEVSARPDEEDIVVVCRVCNLQPLDDQIRDVSAKLVEHLINRAASSVCRGPDAAARRLAIHSISHLGLPAVDFRAVAAGPWSLRLRITTPLRGGAAVPWTRRLPPAKSLHQARRQLAQPACSRPSRTARRRTVGHAARLIQADPRAAATVPAWPPIKTLSIIGSRLPPLADAHR
jgi:hypothetical protein